MTHIVIGGGIMGLLTAHYLVTAGEKVTVIEQGKFGQESSWAGGGILSPLYPWQYPDALNELAAWSQQRYSELVDQLHTLSGIDAQWVQSGLLVMDPEEIPSAEAWAVKNNVSMEIIGARGISRIAPGINQNSTNNSAIWMPEVAQVRNPRLLKALIKSLQLSGVELHERSPVTDLCIANNSITGVYCNEKKISGATVTVACGAWSSKVLHKWLPALNVEPVRGQMILYKANPDTLSPIILKDSHYLIPRKDGRIIVGSTLEFVGFDKSTTENAKEKLLTFALSLLPGLKQFPIEHHWSGLRPGNSVKTPFISRHPTIKGLFINTGHYRNGVVTAPASAALCCDIILSRKSALDDKAYSF